MIRDILHLRHGDPVGPPAATHGLEGLTELEDERRGGGERLDNPAWFALTTRQSKFADGGGSARRYPAEVAPIIAVADPGPEAAAAARTLATAGEALNFIGVVPDDLAGWDVKQTSTIAQLVFDGRPIEPDDDADVEPLGPADVPEMLDLTAAVHPRYFRSRTREMGLYLGIRREGRLIAMAGQRMHADGWREISGVATHPEHRRHGCASRLVARLTAAIAAEGLAPFLHVDVTNAAARAVYEKAGFRWRRDLHAIKVRRRDD